MADGLVTTGEMYDLAMAFAKKTGKRTHINRVTYRYKVGQKLKSEIRYTIAIEDCQSLFHNLTVNEVKGRLTMILDLFYSGVINAASPVQAVPGADRNGTAPLVGPGSREPDAQGQERCDEGSDPVVDQLAGSDDSY